MFKRVVTLALALALLAALFLPFASAETTMYVVTKTGVGLNVRSAARVGNNILGSIKYGEPVTVVSVQSNGWAKVLFGSKGEGYVASRYLSTTKPTSTPSKTASKTTNKTAADTSMTQVNSEFKSMKVLSTPVTLAVAPNRVSSWVYFRWAPNTAASIITSFPSGKRLTAIAEGNNWYQVQDPETGRIGFISKKYTSVVPM